MPVRQLSTRQSGFCGPHPHVAFKTRPPNVSGSWYLFLPSPLCTSSPSSIKFCLPKSIAGAIHISVTLLPPNLEEPRDSGRPAPWFAQTAADGGLTQQKSVSSQFWRLESEFRCLKCWFLLRPLSLAHPWVRSVKTGLYWRTPGRCWRVAPWCYGKPSPKQTLIGIVSRTL